MKSNDKNICDILKFEGIMSGGFGIAPRIVMRDERLSIEAKAIYSYFQSFAGANETAFPSRETILKELNISKNRYYKYLNQLIECDYIRIERAETESGWKKGNIYVIVANPQADYKETVRNNKNSQDKNNKGEKINITSCHHDTKCNGINTKELRKQCSITSLLNKYPEKSRDILLCFELIKDMAVSDQINISGTIKNKEAIQDVIFRLSGDHILYVIAKTEKYKGKINNKRKWLQTCLLNSIYESDEDIAKTINKLSQSNIDPKEIVINEKLVKNNISEKHIKDPHLERLEIDLNNLYSMRAKAIITGSSEIDDLNIKIDNLTKEIEAFGL